MSIGQLGTSGEQFRDFLGGGQRDIGRGLQAVLSAYNNPNGNLVRLDNRAQGMFQLTGSEYQSVFDRDAQNTFAETWYVEYRAVLLLRAEALKKKLNRAYTKVLENSMYAPLRPNEKWAPGANRDFNDIDADAPNKVFANGSGGEIGAKGAPVIPTETEVDMTKYIYEDWFDNQSGANKSSGNAHDDIRRFMADKYLEGVDDNSDGVDDRYLFGDLDGDGRQYYFDPNANEYRWSGEDDTDTSYYDLWNGTAYSLTDSGATSSGRFADIAKEMNIPPSRPTTEFVSGGDPSKQYYIEIPPAKVAPATPAQTSKDVYALLPSFLGGTNGVYTQAERDNSVTTYGVPASAFVVETPAKAGSPPTPATYILKAGTKFYDPNVIATQSLFNVGDGLNAPANSTTTPGVLMNPQLVGPPVGNSVAPGDQKSAQDVLFSGTGPGSEALEPYEAGFIDSWYEARQIEKREASVQAAVDAYTDGYKAIKDAGKTMSYEEVMDQVFVSIDSFGGGPGGGPPPPPGGGTVPAGSATNIIDGVTPYGYYYFDPTTGAKKHASPNTTYQWGGNNKGPGNNSDGSIYTTIYDRLAIAADPTSMDGGGSGTDAIGNNPAAVPIAGSPTPPTAGATDYKTFNNTSKLYTPIPIGAAENPDNAGQPDVRHPDGVDDLEDTIDRVPGFIKGVDEVSKLFVGRQWDYVPGHVPNSGENTTAGVGAVRYDYETISAHINVIPGWFYDSSGGENVGKAIVTIPQPAIDGLAWQTAANNFGLGRFDDTANKLLGGPFFRVAGGKNSLGLGPEWDGSTQKYSIAVGFGAGIGGIYWGQTSAVGTIYKIDRLVEHSGGYDGAVDGTGGKGGGTGFGYDIMTASLGAMAALGGGSRDEMSVFPNLGVFGFHQDFNIPIPIPIPPPGGPPITFLNMPMTTYGAVSYDVVTDYLGRFLDAMQHEVLDSVSAYSYATGGGYAMDSYGMRGEYQFTEKPAYETLEKLPDLFGLVDVGSLIDTAASLVGLEDYTINQYEVKDGGLFGGVDGDTSIRHGVNANEQRELDTGAFFTTASFLSQFELDQLDYSYWSSTYQNEEIANLDTLRLLSMLGKDLMSALNQALFAAAGQLTIDGPVAVATISVLNFMLQSFQAQVNEALMWDILMRDQNEEGFVTSQQITNSSLTAEGYDFLEDERKLFAYDTEEVRAQGILGKLSTLGMGSFEIPNQVMNGTANTRRFKPYLMGADGRAGRQGYGRNSAGTVQPGTYNAPTSTGNILSATANSVTVAPGTASGLTEGELVYVPIDGALQIARIFEISGDTITFTSDLPPGAVDTGTGTFIRDKDGGRVNNVTRRAGDDSYFDDNWDIRVGFWQDTGLGDVNEVYVRKNTVSYGAVNNGIGDANPNEPTVTTQIDRYVGSYNRINGRGYDGAVPLDLQSFRTGYFSDKYFGYYINETDFGEGAVPGSDVAGDDAISYELEGGIDNDPNREGTITLHGGTKYYDRKNDYTFNIETSGGPGAADDTTISLKADQALAPVLGGAMKLASIESNNSGQVIGATTQNQDNELTRVLYDHMRLRSDGSNAQLLAEYRDAFNMGYLDNVFITASADAATGGGVSSSIRLKFRNESWAAQAVDEGAFQARRDDEIVGSTQVTRADGTAVTQNLLTEPGYLGRRSYFKNVNRSITDIYLSSYFAFKRQPQTKAV